MLYDPADLPDEVRDFLTERHLATLTVVRADGSPQVTPVGVTFDDSSRLARVITWADSVKAKLLAGMADRDLTCPVAVCQVDGGRWLTLSGPARLTDEPPAVDEAVARYAARYRQPEERPDRVVIEIEVDHIIGRVPTTEAER